MNGSGQEMTLGETANRFLLYLPPEERKASQQEIYKFVRWFGQNHALNALTPSEIAHYAERLSLSDTDYLNRLDLVRSFLIYARKEKLSRTNLAVHLKARKEKPKAATAPRSSSPETSLLTRQGYNQLEAEIAILKGQSLKLIEEIRHAAAD
ncbi:MAG: hypothetical protein HYX83_00435 [Chloroflexi bacterium]|nr:hypothetical protein [Chloroflexota bacterium]